LIEQLRTAARVDLPSGVVAFLAYEVAHASRLWDDEREGMSGAVGRLGALCNEVVARWDGQVITSINEGERSTVVFREASGAARSALELHDRLARDPLVAGLTVQLKAAVLVGEVRLSNGVYAGPVIDLLMRLRAVAEPGTTIAPEPTAELLVEQVDLGREMTVKRLDRSDPTLPRGTTLFALARPGEPASVNRPLAEAASVSSETTPTPEAPAVADPARRLVATAALEHPVALGGLALAGVAVIFRVILASVFGLETLGTVMLGVGLVVFVASFAWRYSIGRRERDALNAARRRATDGGARTPGHPPTARARVRRHRVSGGRRGPRPGARAGGAVR
jgi:class 3 adenylate cyclase